MNTRKNWHSLLGPLGGGLVLMLLLAPLVLGAEPGGVMDRLTGLVDITGLFVLGLLLILVELFLIPGHGAVALPGCGLILWSAWLCCSRFGMETGLTLVTVELAVAGAVAVGVFKVFPRTPAGRALVHDKHLGGAAQENSSHLDWREWVGRRGVTASDLRPAGTARFDETTLDVACDDGLIERGIEVEIDRIDQGRVIVRRASPS